MSRLVVMVVALVLPVAACGDDGAAGDAGTAVDAEASTAFLTTCFAGLVAPATGFIDVLELGSADGRYRVWLARQGEPPPGLGHTVEFTAVAFAVVAPEGMACITDPGTLGYTVSHHNCYDEAYGVDASGQYDIAMRMELSGWMQTLSARTPASGSPLWGPVELPQRLCRSLPEGAGCPNE